MIEYMKKINASYIHHHHHHNNQYHINNIVLFALLLLLNTNFSLSLFNFH